MTKIHEHKIIYWSLFLVALIFCPITHLQAADQTRNEGKKDMQEVKKEIHNTLQTIKGYSIDKKDEVMAEAKQILDKMDAQIDELEKQSNEKWQDMSEASRENSQQALRELRKKRYEIAEWYGGMKHSSADAWGEMKKGFVDSYKSLQNAFDKAAEKF